MRLTMIADSRRNIRILNLDPQPAWADAWHLWTVTIPRRSISGRLVHGTVLRRHDGRRWIYKKFVEYANDRVE
jgi:hypothetical protein